MKCYYCREEIENQKVSVSRYDFAHPECHQETQIPVSTKILPDITFDPNAEEIKTYILTSAKFEGKCPHCTKKVLKGHPIYWKRGVKVLHKECYLERVKTLPISEV